MKTLIVAAATVFALSFFATVQAQQIDGRDCWQAYTKLQQHRQAGVCREKTVTRGLDGATDIGRAARQRAARAFAEKTANK